MSEFSFLNEEKKSELLVAKERWETFLEQAEKAANTFSVVIIGQQNNGKSTLCNSLLKDWNNSRFRVSDVRETEDIQEAIDEESGITYVDTPGFGTSWANDTERARKEWYRANLIVFAHSVRSGELDADECAVLNELKSVVPGIDKRLFVACSKFGDEDDARVQEAVSAVKKQIADIVSDSVSVVPIDSIFYQEGHADGDDALIQDSNMGMLLQWISENRYMDSPLAVMLEREKVIYQSIVLSAKSILEDAINTQQEEKQQYTSDLNFCWQEQRIDIEFSWTNCAMYKAFSDLEEELSTF